jgi:hypothetical protein
VVVWSGFVTSYQATLEEHLLWLEGRCRHAARRLPGVGGDELLGAVWLRCIARAERGWFDERPTVSLEAQVKSLMGWCLRHEVKAIHRYWDRHGELPARPGERESGGDPLERVEGDNADPLDKLHGDERLAAVMEQVEQVTSPVRGLCFLSRDLPRVVVLRHVQRAKAYRRGGSKMPLRSVEEAYSLLDHERQRDELVLDLMRWKPVLGGIYYAEGPLEGVADDELDKLGKTVERQANRGLEDLQRAMAGWGGDDE